MVSQIYLLALSALATAGNAKTALLLIDVQDCFLDFNTTNGKPGSLAVPASHIIPLINSIRNEKSCLFDEVIRSQDFHPSKHVSFGSTHGLGGFAHLGGFGLLPLKCIKPTSGATKDASCCPSYYLNDHSRTDCGVSDADKSNTAKVLCPPAGWNYSINMSSIISGNTACSTCKTKPADCIDSTQAMWPDHCVQTGDATFPPSLVKKSTDIIVQKGTNLYVDAYSAFMDNTQNLMTELDTTLQAKGITHLFIAGIATDVCVHATVRDALMSTKTGKYNVTVIKDATAAVLGDKTNYDTSVAEMKGFGATIVNTADVLKMACPAVATAVSDAAKKTVGAGILFLGLHFVLGQ